MNFKFYPVRIFLTALSLGFLFARPLMAAGYRTFDTIEEFGEKRFIKATPARLKAGPVVFHPTLKTKIEYDDNILYAPTDARDDVIFDIRPGAVIEIPVDTHQLAVGYEADFETFTKRNSESDQNQSAFGLLDISFPDWYINVLERFSETSGRSGTTFTGRVPRYDNVIHPKVGYKFKRMTAEAGMRHVLRDFRQQVNDRLDYELTEWNGTVYFDLFARLKALAEYSVAQIDYDDDFQRNGTFQQARIGLEGEIRPNMLLKVRAGPHFRSYEQSEKPDFHSWVASVLLEYEMRENLKLEFEFSREPVEATLGSINFLKEHRIRVGAEYKLTPKWKLFNDTKWFRHNYAERLTVGTHTGFRRDNYVQLDTGVRYLFREWLEFEAAYEFLHRDSNFNNADYTDNRFSLSSSLFY